MINFQRIKMKNEHFYLFLGIDFNNVFIVGYGSVPVTCDLLTSSCRPDLCCMGSICIQMDHSMGELNPSACIANLRFWPRIIWSLQWWGYEFVQYETLVFETLIMAAALEEIVAGILVASRSWMDGAMDQIRVGVFVWENCNIMQFEIKLCVLVHVQFRQSMMLKK